MELSQLKSAWNDMPGEYSNTNQIKQMTLEKKHPVLKGIRLQMIIEIAAWIFFLFFYYDMFDGDQKPFLLNLLLIAAVLLLLVHSVVGYLSVKRLVRGDNLKESLCSYLSTIRMYAIISVASRVFAFICLVLFFIAVITFTPNKYLLLAGILIIIPCQVFLLSRIWIKRINKLKEVANALSE